MGARSFHDRYPLELECPRTRPKYRFILSILSRKEFVMDDFTLISTLLLWPLVVINLVLVLAVIRKVNRQGATGVPARKPPLPVGAPAPAFEAQTVEGRPVTLEDFRGRETAFVFMSPGCKPCMEALPRLNALADPASAVGLQLVLVSGGTPTDTAPVVDSAKPRFPVLLAQLVRNPFFDDYRVTGTPFFCVIDAFGKVKSTGVLSWNSGGWHDLVESINRSQSVLKAS